MRAALQLVPLRWATGEERPCAPPVASRSPFVRREISSRLSFGGAPATLGARHRAGSASCVSSDTEGSAQLGTRLDPELGKDAVEVEPDGAVREVKLLPDLAIRKADGSHLRDLQLLGCQLVARVGGAPAAALTRSAEFPPGP